MDPTSRAFNRTTVLMGVVFLAAAAVQWNDPDPMRWIAFYVAAGAISVYAAFRRPHWLLPGAMAVVALVWLAGSAPGAVQSGEPLGEQSRELAGQAVVLIWMGVLAWLGSRGDG